MLQKDIYAADGAALRLCLWAREKIAQKLSHEW
jgi:hypothetical protein